MGNKAEGEGFLKVTGILMIVFGAIAVLVSLTALTALSAVSFVFDGKSSSILYAAGVLSLISSIIELVTGIIGVINANHPEKASTCIGWGGAVIAMNFLGSILTVVGGNSFPVLSFLLGLIIPCLFIYGALKNKQAV